MFLSVVLPFSSRFWLLAFCFGCFCAEEKTKTKSEQPKPRREWQYNAEKHKGKASASRVVLIMQADTEFFAVLIMSKLFIIFSCIHRYGVVNRAR